MEKIYNFNGEKEISAISSALEVNLPEYNNMRRILLHSKYEVNLALSRGIKVFQQKVENDHGGYVIVYIEVPFEELLHVASMY